jgi:NAD(P)H-nitrite reductase large subunit
MENREICHCMGVTYADVEDAMHATEKFSDVLDVFKKVQEATSCSTGCGGCYDHILEAISEIMHS